MLYSVLALKYATYADLTAAFATYADIRGVMSDPGTFSYFRRGEPLSGLSGKVDPGAFDYFRRGEPIRSLPFFVPSSTISVSDASSGAEASALTALLSDSDTQAGVDGSALATLWTITDGPSGADASSLTALTTPTDGPAGADATVLAVLEAITDSLSGADAGSLGGASVISVSDVSSLRDGGVPVNLGKTGVGASEAVLTPNEKFGCGPYAFPGGQVTKISAFLSLGGSSSTSSDVVALIFSDSSGQPGSLLATSAPLTVANLHASGGLWYDFTFTGVNLSAGNVHIIFLTSYFINVFYDTGAGVTFFFQNQNDDFYSDGPTDPYGAVAGTNPSTELSAYITYAPTGGAVLTALYVVPQAETGAESGSVVGTSNLVTGTQAASGADTASTPQLFTVYMLDDLPGYGVAVYSVPPVWSLDYFRRAEPFRFLRGTAIPGQMNYFRRGEVLPAQYKPFSIGGRYFSTGLSPFSMTASLPAITAIGADSGSGSDTGIRTITITVPDVGRMNDTVGSLSAILVAADGSGGPSFGVGAFGAGVFGTGTGVSGWTEDATRSVLNIVADVMSGADVSVLAALFAQIDSIISADNATLASASNVATGTDSGATVDASAVTAVESASDPVTGVDLGSLLATNFASVLDSGAFSDSSVLAVIQVPPETASGTENTLVVVFDPVSDTVTVVEASTLFAGSQFILSDAAVVADDAQVAGQNPVGTDTSVGLDHGSLDQTFDVADSSSSSDIGTFLQTLTDLDSGSVDEAVAIVQFLTIFVTETGAGADLDAQVMALISMIDRMRSKEKARFRGPRRSWPTRRTGRVVHSQGDLVSTQETT